MIDAAIADGANAYTPYRGNREVLEPLAHSISGFLGTAVGTENLVLTPGTQAGLFTTLATFVDPGDLVLIADPEYLFSERMLAFLGAKVYRIPISYDGEERTPSLDLDLVETLLDERPRLLLLSHPNNPTGAVYSRKTVSRLAQIARRGSFHIVVDELYSRLVYGDEPFPHLAAEPGMEDYCITLLGPSKTESMSGFRVGVVVGPADVVEGIEQMTAVTSLRAPAYSQTLLVKWLVDDHEFIETRRQDLYALQTKTAQALRSVSGLEVAAHRGTAYLFPDVSALGVPDVTLAERLRDDAKVIVSPGYQFGPAGCGHFRVCYARDESKWEYALDRIVACLSDIGVSRCESPLAGHGSG